MFRQLLIVVLAIAIVPNPGLYLGHSHDMDEVSGLENHTNRPHIHLGNGGHTHTHSHGHSAHHSQTSQPTPQSLASPPVSEHDSDAVYCDATVMLGGSHDYSDVLLADSDASAVCILAGCPDQSPRGHLNVRPFFSVFDPATPIYLRTLSLRI